MKTGRARPARLPPGVPGYDRSSWVVILAPAGVPRDVIVKLNTVLVKVANTAGMKEIFTRQGLEAQTNSPEQFAAYIAGHLEQNVKLIRAIGMRPE